jgi:hypothetical protein
MTIKNLTQLNVLSFRVCLRILFVTNKNMGLSLEDYQRQRCTTSKVLVCYYIMTSKYTTVYTVQII